MVPQLMRWLTAAVSLIAVGAGTIALHEARVVDELGRRCDACDGRPAALADARRRLDAAQARYAGLRERYELRVLEARREEAALLAAYAHARARTQAHAPATVTAGA